MPEESKICVSKRFCDSDNCDICKPKDRTAENTQNNPNYLQ